MSFTSMVWFMVKWAVASVPAAIMLLLSGALIYGFFTGLVPH